MFNFILGFMKNLNYASSVCGMWGGGGGGGGGGGDGGCEGRWRMWGEMEDVGGMEDVGR